MKINVLELIDFEEVNKLLEGFNKTTGFVTAILDLEGKVLSKSGWRQICTDFHRIHPESARNCTVSDTVLAKKLKSDERYHFYQCLNGLVDVAVPIVIKGEHVANLFSGQFFIEKPDPTFFQKQADKYGFDKQAYLNAFEKVPIVTMEKVKVAMDFLLDMTQLISEITLQKIEQTHLNEALWESEFRYEKLYENGPFGMVIADNNFRFAKANPAFCSIMGYSETELQKMTFMDLTHPEDQKNDLKNIQKLINKQIQVYKTDKRYIRKDGQTVWGSLTVTSTYDSEGNFLYNLGIVEDISERIKKEEKIREKEMEFRKLSANVPDLIFQFTRKLDGSYCVPIASEGIRNIFGCTPEDVINDFTPIASVLYPEDAERVIREIEYSAEHLTFFTCEFRVQIPGREIQWIYSNSSPERLPDGSITWYGFNTDITPRILAEKAIREMNETLEQRVAERTTQLEMANSEMEAFSYSVSHDLRAPLRHINGYVDLLNDRFKENLPEKAQHYLSTISSATKQMGNLIDDLLQFSRTGRQELHKTRFDMNTLFTEVFDKMKPDLKDRNIIWNVQKLPMVFGDYSLLKQVWVNLLDNAVKYTRLENTTEISINYTEEGGNFVFLIRDNGVGFNMKYASKLFGVFQRLHSQAEFEGTGIGLANVHRILQKHDGKIWAEAELNKGATFYFSLPKK